MARFTFVIFKVYMLILIVVIAFWGMCAAQRGGTVIQKLLVSLMLSATASVALAEFLSLFNAVTLPWMVAGWILVALASWTLAWRGGRGASAAERGTRWSKWDIALISLLALLPIGAFVTAIVAPPNNYDAMTYHVARVAHWIENQSTRPYPTHVARQIHLGPAAEYVILSLNLLSQSDRLTNLVQWTAMLGSIAGVWHISRQLGANRWGQITATIFCGTVPIGILEASDAQNDWVLTFFLICLACAVMDIVNQKQLRIGQFALAGLALGLALLTKGTAYVFAPGLVAYCLIGILRSRHRFGAVAPALIALLIAVSINLPFWTWNYRLTGNALGPGAEDGIDGARIEYSNSSMGPATIFSNVVRNLATELATPFQAINRNLFGVALDLHRGANLDENDPGTTFLYERFGIGTAWNSFDGAGNPLHVTIAFLAILLAVVLKKQRKLIGGYTVAVASGFLLFCAYLRWQPWHTRLLLPIFGLLAPTVGIVCERLLNRVIVRLMLLLLLSQAAVILVYAYSHPWWGPKSIFTNSRLAQYFAGDKYKMAAFESAAAMARDPAVSKVGLVTDNNSYEYPMWVLLHKYKNEVQIEHVEVHNYTRNAPPPENSRGFSPDLIIRIDARAGPIEGTYRTNSSRP